MKDSHLIHVATVGDGNEGQVVVHAAYNHRNVPYVKLTGDAIDHRHAAVLAAAILTAGEILNAEAE